MLTWSVYAIVCSLTLLGGFVDAIAGAGLALRVGSGPSPVHAPDPAGD